jgi:class 3 adenylate cyclase
MNMNNYGLALDYFNKALRIANETEDRSTASTIYANLGSATFKIHTDSLKKDTTGRFANLVKASDYYEKAVSISGQIGELHGKMNYLYGLHQVDSALGYYDKALSAYKEARLIQDSIFSAETQKKIADLDAKRDLEAKTSENQILQQKTQIQQLALSKQKQDYQLLNTRHRLQALEIVKKNADLALLQKDKNIKDLELKKSKAEGDKKVREIAFLNKDRQYQSVVRSSLIGAFVLASAIALLIFFFLRRKGRDNKKLKELNEAIKAEEDKSESLLQNILPAPVASRLKEGEKHLSDYFDEASIVFIDIVDFSVFSSNTTPERLIEVLNNVYTEFDNIAEKYSLEKIKTIGDCYMAVSGVPVRNSNHGMDAALFASEAMEIMNGFSAGDGKKLYFRAGIDCGPVVAGVIGEKKFIYDLWGDAVNTASRMEEFGETGKIQCTGRFRSAFYSTDGHDSLFSFKERGQIEIKGKGYMHTYFLERATAPESEIAY